MSLLQWGAGAGRPRRPKSASNIIRPAQPVGAGESVNPIRLCVPSQNGFVAEPPQRHSTTTCAGEPSFRGGIGSGLPSGPSTRIAPATTRGPFGLGVIVTSLMPGILTRSRGPSTAQVIVTGSLDPHLRPGSHSAAHSETEAPHE